MTRSGRLIRRLDIERRHSHRHDPAERTLLGVLRTCVTRRRHNLADERLGTGIAVGINGDNVIHSLLACHDACDTIAGIIVRHTARHSLYRRARQRRRWTRRRQRALLLIRSRYGNFYWCLCLLGVVSRCLFCVLFILCLYLVYFYLVGVLLIY